MNEEAMTCAAAFFRTVGKDVTTAEEFVMGTSLEMKWMSPSDSKLLLKLLISEGALVQKGDYIRPSPEIADADVPLAYRPSPEFLEMVRAGPKPAAKKETVQDMFHVLMDAAVEGGMARTDFVQSCNKTSKKLGIDISAAALIVLRDNGIGIEKYVERVYDGLKAV